MIAIRRSNIVELHVDAIVNAANESLRGGGGVDGAIHRAAGPGLLEECKRYSGLPTGDALLTGGHRLPARYIIHTVGPIWHGVGDEDELLERAYESVFRVAQAQGDIRTIAFPAISTGVYAFPQVAAAEIAVRSMLQHEAQFDQITVCLMDDENVAAYERELRSKSKL